MGWMDALNFIMLTYKCQKTLNNLFTKYIPDLLQDLLEVCTTKKDKISKVNLDALHKQQLSS